MLETILLVLFSIALLACVLSGASILIALTFGLALFSGYAFSKGNNILAVLRMWWSGVHTILPILTTFVLIGMITAFWRAAGTIPAIVAYGSSFVSPALIVFATFWLCALVSVLTGTAFGTGATMGVICMTMARSLGISEFSQLFVGGAIVAGSYYGDRMSPMSTSALLVATITHTDIYRNLRAMFRTAFVPTVMASVIYLAFGYFSALPPSQRGEGHEVAGGVSEVVTNNMIEPTGGAVASLFASNFDLSFVTLIPALLIILFSFLRWHVQRMMAVSIVAAVIIAVAVQGVALTDLPRIAILGYWPDDAALSSAIGGGGIISMVRIAVIVGLASCYAGLFEATGFLRAFAVRIAALAAKITPFGSVAVAGLLTGMISYNQTLSIILTHDLCKTVVIDREQLAVDLENTAVILSPIIPWSIAAGVPLAATGAPTACLVFAVYLYLVTLWNLGVAVRKNRP